MGGGYQWFAGGGAGRDLGLGPASQGAAVPTSWGAPVLLLLVKPMRAFFPLCERLLSAV